MERQFFIIQSSMKKTFSCLKCLLLIAAVMTTVLAVEIGLHRHDDSRLKEFLESRTPVPLSAVEFPNDGIIFKDKVTLDYLSHALADSIKYGNVGSHTFGKTCTVVFILCNGSKIKTDLDLFRAGDGFTILGPYDSGFKDPIPFEVKFIEPVPSQLSQAIDRLNR